MLIARIGLLQALLPGGVKLPFGDLGAAAASIRDHLTEVLQQDLCELQRSKAKSSCLLLMRSFNIGKSV